MATPPQSLADVMAATQKVLKYAFFVFATLTMLKVWTDDPDFMNWTVMRAPPAQGSPVSSVAPIPGAAPQARGDRESGGPMLAMESPGRRMAESLNNGAFDTGAFDTGAFDTAARSSAAPSSAAPSSAAPSSAMMNGRRMEDAGSADASRGFSRHAPPGAAARPAPFANAASRELLGTWHVQSGALNVRDHPGLHGQVVDGLYGGDEVMVYEVRNSYGRITQPLILVDGSVAEEPLWVAMQYLARTPPPPAPPAPEPVAASFQEDPRIPPGVIPSYGDASGLAAAQVDILREGAKTILDHGVCKDVQWADVNPETGMYYVLCDDSRKRVYFVKRDNRIQIVKWVTSGQESQ